MPKFFEAPALIRYGTVSEITASDLKCTPGTDGGFTFFEHGDGLDFQEGVLGGGVTGPIIALADFSPTGCDAANNVVPGSYLKYGDGTVS